MIEMAGTGPCVEWQGCKDRDGYGKRRVNSRYVRAHRAVVAAVYGWDAIEGKLVLHKCDNPSCVRFGHLKIGTHAENMADMVAKGRQRQPPPHGTESRYCSAKHRCRCRPCKDAHNAYQRARRKARA